MDGVKVWHFVRSGGKIIPVCNREEGVSSHNTVIDDKQTFFEKHMSGGEERCPYCEAILYKEEYEKLKGLFKDLREICKKILNVSV